MLGHIIGIEENLVSVELNPEQTNQEMMNRHVILEDGRQVIGEIVDVKDGVAYVMLLGELKESKFIFGVVKKPSFQAKISFVPNDKIEYIIGISDYAEDKDLYIGKSPIYENVNIGFRINDFFSSHFAIFGSTGSGKSCSIARILQIYLGRKKRFHIALVCLFLMPMENIIMLLKNYMKWFQKFNLNLIQQISNPMKNW